MKMIYGIHSSDQFDIWSEKIIILRLKCVYLFLFFFYADKSKMKYVKHIRIQTIQFI